MKEIIVGYDGSEEADRALARAAQIAEAFSSKLVVASVKKYVAAAALAPVAPGPIVVPAASGSIAVAPTETPPPAEIDLDRSPAPEDLAERQLERARSRLAGRSLETEYVTDVGDAAQRLLELAQRRDADLIVVGSREHGFLEHVLGLSCDEKIARRAHTDVLLVH
jgi:nucleotide-binding universal stress UspA family protein